MRFSEFIALGLTSCLLLANPIRAAQSPAEQFDPATQSDAQQQERVFLFRAAELDYSVTGEARELLESLAPNERATLEILTSADGAISGCSARFPEFSSREIVDELCADIKRNAKLTEQAVFYAGGREGIAFLVFRKDTRTGLEELRPSFSDEPGIKFLDYAPAQIPEELLINVEDLLPSRPVPANYPSRALRMELEGRVEVLLAISNGRVKYCRPTLTSGSAILDYAACRGFRRYARFSFKEPPADPSAIRYHKSSVNYRLN